MAVGIIIRNEAGEERTLAGEQGTIPAGWKAVGLAKGARFTRRMAERKAKLAVWTTRLGLPVPAFLEAARWLLDKDCPYCELATLVLRRLEGVDPAKATQLLERIIEAKANQDYDVLEDCRRAAAHL